MSWTTLYLHCSLDGALSSPWSHHGHIICQHTYRQFGLKSIKVGCSPTMAPTKQPLNHKWHTHNLKGNSKFFTRPAPPFQVQLGCKLLQIKLSKQIILLRNTCQNVTSSRQQFPCDVMRPFPYLLGIFDPYISADSLHSWDLLRRSDDTLEKEAAVEGKLSHTEPVAHDRRSRKPITERTGTLQTICIALFTSFSAALGAIVFGTWAGGQTHPSSRRGQRKQSKSTSSVPQQILKCEPL